MQSSAEDHVSGGEAGSDCRVVTESGGCSTDGQPAWINSLVGRIFWDFLREKYWTDQVAHKIQKKLSKIKVKLADLMLMTVVFLGGVKITSPINQ